MDTTSFLDYYKILQCERTASEEELKRSYQRLVLLFHPDKVGAGREDDFLILQQAWSVLKDPASRRQYDAELASHEDDQYLIYNRISLSEMEYNSSEDVYTYQCRCSGYYCLEPSELSCDKVDIGCNECSFSLHVDIKK